MWAPRLRAALVASAHAELAENEPDVALDVASRACLCFRELLELLGRRTSGSGVCFSFEAERVHESFACSGPSKSSGPLKPSPRA